jgi:hypothetical protein
VVVSDDDHVGMFVTDYGGGRWWYDDDDD